MYYVETTLKWLLKVFQVSVKVMSQQTIRNDDFERNTAYEYWSNVATIRNNVATMMQRCVALKVVFANRLV